MKVIKHIITAVCLLVSAVSCYEPYVKDYDYSGVYVAYQYDLRSLVVGEGMSFNFGAVLGGVIDNNRDRTVEFVLDDALVTESLASYGGTTAMEGMMQNPSQAYVSSAIEKAGIGGLVPIPRNCFSIDRDGSMTIARGRHTATVRFSADSLALLSDAHAGPGPYYALGWRITRADADTVLLEKSFQIIALRLENTFFGSWYRSGESWEIEDASGAEVAGSRKSYPNAAAYKLTTTGPYSCSTDYFHNTVGTMTVHMDGQSVSVSGAGITDTGSSWNKAKLLQDRKIYLNYCYAGTGGRSTVVRDTLSFRNRERDGVNEWQDPDPEHYK